MLKHIPGGLHPFRRARGSGRCLVRRPFENRTHLRTKGAAGHRSDRRCCHRRVRENRGSIDKGLHTNITGPWTETKQGPQAEITTAVNKTFQHLLLQRIQTGVAEHRPDAADAFCENRMILIHHVHPAILG